MKFLIRLLAFMLISGTMAYFRTGMRNEFRAMTECSQWAQAYDNKPTQAQVMWEAVSGMFTPGAHGCAHDQSVATRTATRNPAASSPSGQPLQAAQSGSSSFSLPQIPVPQFSMPQFLSSSGTSSGSSASHGSVTVCGGTRGCNRQ